MCDVRPLERVAKHPSTPDLASAWPTLVRARLNRTDGRPRCLGSSSSAPWMGLFVWAQMNCVLDDLLLAAFALGFVAVVHAEYIHSLCMAF